MRRQTPGVPGRPDRFGRDELPHPLLGLALRVLHGCLGAGAGGRRGAGWYPAGVNCRPMRAAPVEQGVATHADEDQAQGEPTPPPERSNH